MAMSPEEKRRKICERARGWWLLNKERAAENKRQWRMRQRQGLQEKRKILSPEERKQKACERARKWHHANQERAQERQRAKPERKQARVRKRRATQMGAEGSFTPKDIARIYSLQQGKCAGCGIEFKTTGVNRYHIDHIIPLRPADGSKPGSNWPENLQLLCRPCNCSKSNLTLEEWKRRKG